MCVCTYTVAGVLDIVATSSYSPGDCAAAVLAKLCFRLVEDFRHATVHQMLWPQRQAGKRGPCLANHDASSLPKLTEESDPKSGSRELRANSVNNITRRSNALESSWFDHLTPGLNWFTLDVNSAEGVCFLCAKAWPRMMWFFLSCTQEIVHGLRHRYVMRLLYQEYCVRFADCLSCGLSGVFCWVGNIANKSGLRMHNFVSVLGMVVGGACMGM